MYYLCGNPAVIPDNGTVSKDIIFAAALLWHWKQLCSLDTCHLSGPSLHFTVD